MKKTLLSLILGTTLSIINPTNVIAQDTNKKPIKEDIKLESRLADQAERHEDMYDKYAEGREYFLEHKDGKIKAVNKKGEKVIFEREDISSEVAKVIRKIYNPSKNIDKDFWKTEYVFNEQIGYEKIEIIRNLNSRLPDNLKQPQDLINKVEDNLKKSGKNAEQFLRAIDLLSRDSKEGNNKVSAAIWYLSKIDGAGYVTLSNGKTNLKEPDLTTITAADFTENIDYAFRARAEFPWAKEVSEPDFLEYVLPGRVTQEPLSSSSRKLRYHALRDSVKGMKTAGEVVTFLNRIVRATVGFEQTGFEDESPALRLAAHTGRCEDQTNELVDLAKAVGIPGFHMGVNAHAKADGNHTWFGMKAKSETGNEDYFSVNSGYPSEEDPRAFNGIVAAKISATSPFGKRDDVTPYFTTTANLRIGAENYLGKQESGKAILHVMNSGMPVAVRSVEMTPQEIRAEKLGSKTGILYHLALNQRNWQDQGPLKQLTHPFVFEENGVVKFLDGEPEQRELANPYNLDKEFLTERVNDIVEGHQTGGVNSQGIAYIRQWDSKIGFWDMNNVRRVPVEINPSTKEAYIKGAMLVPQVLYQGFRENGERIGRPFAVMKDGSELKLRSL